MMQQSLANPFDFYPPSIVVIVGADFVVVGN